MRASDLDCGGKRSATPLWKGRFTRRLRDSWSVEKRRRRCALPAHSKTRRSVQAVRVKVGTVAPRGPPNEFRGLNPSGAMRPLERVSTPGGALGETRPTSFGRSAHSMFSVQCWMFDVHSVSGHSLKRRRDRL